MLTKKELADTLKISVYTVDRMVAKGMPRVKIGSAVRFDYNDVAKWLKERGEK